MRFTVGELHPGLEFAVAPNGKRQKGKILSSSVDKTAQLKRGIRTWKVRLDDGTVVSLYRHQFIATWAAQEAANKAQAERMIAREAEQQKKKRTMENALASMQEAMRRVFGGAPLTIDFASLPADDWQINVMIPAVTVEMYQQGSRKRVLAELQDITERMSS